MDETIKGLRSAAQLVGVTPETVRLWCNKHGGELGALSSSGVWLINRATLLKVAADNKKAHATLAGLVDA